MQKLAYFVQVAGEPLRLDYQAHHYGPYADNLRHVLHHIEGHYVRGFGDGQNKPETPLELIEGAASEAEAFLASNGDSPRRTAISGRLPAGRFPVVSTQTPVTTRSNDRPDKPTDASCTAA